MRKVQVQLVKTGKDEYIASSPDSLGFFAIGETREEALLNIKEGLSIFLSIDENEIELEITEFSEKEVQE